MQLAIILIYVTETQLLTAFLFGLYIIIFPLGFGEVKQKKEVKKQHVIGFTRLDG